MVRRVLIMVAAALAATMIFPTVAVAQVPWEPGLPWEDPGTTQRPADPGDPTTEDDMYADCREWGENVPGPLGSVVEGVCDVGTAALNPGEAAGEALKGVVGRAAEEFADGWKKGIALMFSWWYRTPITSSTSSDGTSDLVGSVHEYLRFFQVCAFIVSVLIAVGRVALASAQLRSQHATEAATMVVRTVVVSSMGVGLIVLADDAMRASSVWLLETMAGGVDPGQALERIIQINTLGSLLGAGLLFVFAVMGVCGVIAQMVFILIQIAVSKLVLGVLPLAASFSGTEAGKQAYNKLTAWTAVFLLFPPVTALIYGTAFSLTLGAEDAQGALAGMILLTLSALALPALVRLMVPMAGQVSGGSGAAVMSGALLASGAAPLLGGFAGGASKIGEGGQDPAASGGRSDSDAPTGAVAAPTSTSPPGGSSGPAGAAPSGGGAAGSGAASSGGAAAGAAGAAAGPIGAAAGEIKQRVEGAGQGAGQILADGAQRGTGSPDVPPPPPGPPGSVPPSGGRSDGEF
ncbi:hypothetical protein [Nocardia carnea]|uniref:hypothetical protein n=1 Tax=Nocardia carnea TaxID=37328 RepID=UPI0012DE5782|nr:hypothetical protein [Nocardia carnea]